MTATKQPIILFQGDSITDGGRGRGEDQDHVLGQSYPCFVAARLGYELAEQLPVFYNRGISGNRVSDLYARWNEDAIFLKPDVLSILIGVNDAWRIMNELPAGAADRFEEAYRHVLDTTKKYLPETGLVLCEPFILNTGATADKWEGWVEILTRYQAVTKQLAKEYGALFVPLQQPLNDAAKRSDAAYWLRDGVHPTAAGHELIAREWLKAVQGSPLGSVLRTGGQEE
jgi:lysophospholipase L1-like esterase